IESRDLCHRDSRLYTRDTGATLRCGMLPIRLNLANGRSREVPIGTWKSGDSGSSETIKNGQVVRALVHDAVTVSATITRSHDTIWAEVIISNRSNRRIAVEPQAFVLSEISPTRVALQHHIVNGTVAHPLVTDTLKS